MPLCKKHREEVTHMCECEKTLICSRCMEKHSGFEHTKITTKELGHSYASHINKSLLDLDERLGRYSTTTAGKINFITTEYINGMHAMVDDFKKAITKRYEMIRDTFEPFQKIDEKALEMKEIADELAEMDGVPDDIMDKMALCEKNLGEIDDSFGTVGELNEKTADLEGEIDTDLRDELAEFRDYIEDLFLTFRFPMDYDDTGFAERSGGLKKKGKSKGAAYMGFGGKDGKKGKGEMQMENEKYVKGNNEDDIQVDIEEEFEVMEGRTYKGHSSWIQDIIRLGSNQFATCDEKGMIVLWNRKANKQKSISATTSEGEAESVHCLSLAGASNNWIIGGCSSGSVFFVNVASSQKRMVENFMEDDILGITSLKQYKNKFVIVQDSQFNIKLFDVEVLVDSSVTADPKKLSQLEITQRPKSKEDRQDIYFGDNKLIELRNSNYGKTKKWFSTFVLSAISTTRRVNLYVIEMHTKRKGIFSCKKKYSFTHQFLKSFKFDYSPTSILELSEDKIAVATGKYIKVLDIKGSKEAGIMYEGHEDRIRTLSKVKMLNSKFNLFIDNKESKGILGERWEEEKANC